MQNTSNSGKKYVFVCGLHRSGTTVLARELGRLENCTVFAKTGVTMDKGQFLQEVYPPDTVYGGAGLFAFDARAHLTEKSSLLTPENAARLRASWEAHWDPKKNICVEKTPGNIVMTRFLQEVFPDCYFIVLKRHPVAVSLATQKWSRTPLHQLFDHWLRCHELYEADKKQLKHLYEIKYEDYIKNPRKAFEEMAAFLGSRAPEDQGHNTSDGHNQKYFERWAGLVQDSRLRSYYRHIWALYEGRFRTHGYSLDELAPAAGTERVTGRATAAGAVLRLGCGAWAPVRLLSWRLELALRLQYRRLFAKERLAASEWVASSGRS